MLGFKEAKACHIGSSICTFESCSQVAAVCYGTNLAEDSDFAPDLGGCALGFATSRTRYKILGLTNEGLGICCASPCVGICVCLQDATWDATPSYEGQVCKKRWGADCGWLSLFGWQPLGGEKEGRWDPDSGYCVICDGKIEIERFDCSGDYSGDNKCEHACGADPDCDERSPGIPFSKPSSLDDFLCTSDCNLKICSNNTACTSSMGYKCTYRWHYSPPDYYALWEWISTTQFSQDSNSYEDGSPWHECFDGVDNDCDDNKDCKDPQCAGKRKEGTTEICCQYDSDCPPQNNIKGKCDSPLGSDNPDTAGYTYRCYWKPCARDADCVPGTYCYCGVCSSTHTSAGCPAGQCCNKGYGYFDIGSGECVDKGTIYNSDGVSYLCDPPQEDLSKNNQKFSLEAKIKEIYHSVLSFLAYFSHQR